MARISSRTLKDGSRFDSMKFNVGDVAEGNRGEVLVIVAVEAAGIYGEDGHERGWAHQVRPATAAEQAEYFRPRSAAEIEAEKRSLDRLIDALDN